MPCIVEDIAVNCMPGLIAAMIAHVSFQRFAESFWIPVDSVHLNAGELKEELFVLHTSTLNYW